MTIDEPIPGADGQDLGSPPDAADKVLGRVTKDMVDAKAKEAQSAWSSVMDEMETSKETQGDYFIKLGHKSETEDSRALLLTTPAGEGNMEQYVAFTREGPMVVSYLNTRALKEILSDLDNVDGENVRSGYFRTSDDQYKHTLELVRKSNGIATKLTFEDREDYTDQLVDQALKRSIGAAEAPHKANLEAANESLDLAQSYFSKISQLPPKE